MGKALKSSMKALQEAIVNFIPTGPTCMQQGRTDSFRDFYGSFSSIYYTATASSVSSSSVPPHALYPAPSNGPPPFDAPLVPPDDEFCDPALDVDIVAARAGSSCCSSGASSSSSSLPAAIECENIGDAAVAGPFVPMGPAGAASGSGRFFYSPKTTKSIMEEAKLEAAGLRKMRSLNDRAGPGPELHGEAGVEELEDDGVEEEEVVVKEAGSIGHEAGPRPHPNPRRHRRRHRRHRSKGGSFCEDSTPLVMSSHNPYMDFRCSMEEMVEAHGVSDWSGLQELLLCYLRLNDKGTHSVIMLAFADLVMHIVSTSESFSSSTTTNSTAGTTNTSSVMSFCNPTPYSSSSPVLNPCSD